MSRDEQERLRDIQVAIAAIREHLKQADVRVLSEIQVEPGGADRR